MNNTDIALPWTYDGQDHYGDNGGKYRDILDAHGNEVTGEYACVSHEEAEFIVRSVNSHDALVEALKKCVARMIRELPDPQDIDELYFALNVLSEAEKP